VNDRNDAGTKRRGRESRDTYCDVKRKRYLFDGFADEMKMDDFFSWDV
jgi:hypothetical protein